MVANAQKLVLLLALAGLGEWFHQQCVHAAQPKPRVPAAAAPRMVITTAVLAKPCSGSTGNYVNLLSIRNKQDYAQLHGYGLYWTSDTLDPSLSGAWNKVAVLLALMRNGQYAHTEWFLWVDYDTLFANMSTTIPFHKYAGKDLVVWGDHQKMLHDYDAHGTNTGVLLVRNTPRAYDLLTDLANLGRNWNGGNSTHAQAMRETLRNFQVGLYDQNGLVFLMQQRPQYRAALFLESLEGSYGLHSHFVANLPLTMIEEWGLPLVVHYAGCQFCSEGKRVGHFGLHYCLKHFFSINNMATAIIKERQGEKWQPPPVMELIYNLERADPALDAEFKQRKRSAARRRGMARLARRHGI